MTVEGRIWSGRRDSNPLPTAWEAVALPGELLPRMVQGNLVYERTLS